jgi:hypothetical protein
LDVLERDLGVDWIRKAMEKYRGLKLDEALPYFIYLGPAHTLAYADLVEVALRLELLRNQPGMGRIRKFLRGIPRPDQFGHIMMQLAIGSIASRIGYEVSFESVNLNSGRPIDLVLQGSAGSLRGEMALLLPEENFRETDKRTNRLFDQIRNIELRYDVTCAGRLPEQLDDAIEAQLLLELEAAAGVVHEKGTSRGVEIATGILTVSSGREASTAELSAPFPVGDPGTRLMNLLERKAGRTVGEESVWLVVDARHGLWQFTGWSQLDLPHKLSALQQLVSESLGSQTHVAGVVVTSGCVHAQGVFFGESCRIGDCYSLRRLVEPLRVRGTVIITLDSASAHASETWRGLYDQEPEWLNWALGRMGLPPKKEIFVPSDRSR